MHNRGSLSVNVDEENSLPQGSSSELSKSDVKKQKQGGLWKRRTLIALVALLATGIVVGSIWQVLPSIGGNPEAIPVDRTHNILSTQSYTVNDHPLIVITNHVGSIFVHSGGVQNQVLIKSIQKVSDTDQNPEDQRILVTNNRQAQLIVNVEGPQDIAVTEFDVDITIAGNANLVLNTLAGDIRVEGVIGNENVTTDAGTINLTDADLQQASKFVSTSGSVRFNGRVDRLGSATFHSDNGDLDLLFPRALPLDFRASSIDGKVTHDSGVPITGEMSGGDTGLYISSGDFPRALVTADSITGSVNVGLR
ncbi:MAG TPA: DUF4097 family beta strand repeat-containing protein [Ktedonobacteraceae bacterium]|nr:DUF4097 family beta strand repeat-containing protein [Ktedonobacteraceae bacterium]